MSAYIDTNIYDYVALKHPRYGVACKQILEDVAEGRLEGHGSLLVAIEILGSLSEITPEIAKGALEAYFSLPIRAAPLHQHVIENASEIAVKTNVSYDAIHAAAMCASKVSTIITEDIAHWDRIRRRWPSLKTKMDLDMITVVRPLAYQRWKR